MNCDCDARISALEERVDELTGELLAMGEAVEAFQALAFDHLTWLVVKHNEGRELSELLVRKIASADFAARMMTYMASMELWDAIDDADALGEAWGRFHVYIQMWASMWSSEGVDLEALDVPPLDAAWLAAQRSARRRKNDFLHVRSRRYQRSPERMAQAANQAQVTVRLE